MHHPNGAAQANLTGVQRQNLPPHSAQIGNPVVGRQPPAVQYPVEGQALAAHRDFARRHILDLGSEFDPRAIPAQGRNQGGQQRTRIDFAFRSKIQPFAEAAFQLGLQLAQLVAPQPAQPRSEAGTLDSLGEMLHSRSILSMRDHQCTFAGQMHRLRQRRDNRSPQIERSLTPAGDFIFRLAQLAVRRQHPGPDMTAMMVQALATALEHTDPMPLAL